MAEAASSTTPAAAAPTAHLRVAISSGALKRSDETPEDDFKTWIAVALTDRAGRFWYSDAENLGKTSVTNGFEAPYAFARQSKDIPLEDGAFSDLVGSSVVLNVYKGGARDATKDQLIGFVSFSLKNLVSGQKLKGKYPLLAPQQSPIQPAGTVVSPVVYSGQLTVEIRGDAPFEEHCLGCRVLELPALSLQNIPKRWRLPESEWSEAEETTNTTNGAAGANDNMPADPLAVAAMCNDPNENTFRYVISLPFPTTANAANAGGGNSSNTVHLATGKVILKSLAPPPSTAPAETSGTAPPPSTAPAAAAPSTASGTAKADAGKGAAAKGGKDAAAAPALSAADAAAAAGPWIWCVEWKASKLFLHKSSVTALQAHIASGNSLDGTFRRVQIEAVEEDDPLDPVFGLEQGLRLAEEDYAYRGAVSLVLDSLLTAGETVLKTETDLKPPVDPVSEEEKAADATAKATRDAQWAEYQANKAKAAGGKGGKDAKGGKAPAKGKDAKGKDAKGKDAKGKDAKGGKGGADAGPAENAAPPPHPFIAAGSFVRYNLTLNTPLNPRPPTPPPVKISASDLIPSRPKPLQQPPGLDASQSFRREVANAVVAIAREYSLTIQRLQAQQQQQQQQQGGGGGNIPEEVKRRELLASLKTSGVYSSMKSTFKTAALRIAKERFSHMPGAADPSGSLGRDMLVSYLYAYLIGQMHAAVNSSLGEAELAASLVTGIEGVMNSMGAGAGAQQGQGQGQGQGAAPAAAGPGEGETASMRLRRIALECESSGRFARAERCHQSRVMHLEEASAKGSSLGVYASLPAWHDFALFYCRRGGKAYLKALTCLREALSIDSKFIPSLVLAASVQAIRGQLEEALVYSDSAMHLCEEALGGPSASRGEQQEVNPADPFVNAAPLCYGLHSLLLTLKGSNKSEESGHALLEGTSALQQLLISRGLPEEEAQRCGTAGAILLIVSRSLLSAGLNSLARKSLQLAADALADTDAPPSQKADLLILRAKWFLQTVNALASVELKENTASQDVSDASDGQLTAADAAVGAAAVGGGGAPVRRKSRGPAGQGGLDATVASLAAGNAPGASSGGIAGGSSGAGTASGSNPLHFTALGIRVPISLTSGKAYDGAPVTGAQCEAELDKALALTASAGIGNGNGAPEAWFLKASLHLSGLLQPDSNLPLPLYGEGSGVDGNTILGGVVGGGGGPSISVGIPSVLAGSPDPADVDPIDVNRAIACLEMAMGNHLEPVGLSAGGGMVSSFLNRAPLSVTGLPALMAAATASASSEEEAQQAVMTLVSAEVSSYGNVGGGCLHDDEFHGARTYLLCASLHLHMSTVASDTTPMAGPPGVVSRTAGQHLEAARESFLRAAEATRSVHSESSPAEAAAHAALTTELAGAGHMSAAAAAVSSSSAQPSFQQTKAWSIALLGLGRVAWASNDAVLAEALLSEANVLDNQNSSVWGWLAFLCLNSEPLRDREAAASIDQALKLGLVGDNAETTVLLQGLADRYRELGQPGVAVSLVKRALVQKATPVSAAHAESIAQAQMSLAEALVAEGRHEESIAAYRKLIEFNAPPHKPGFQGAAASLASIDAVKKSAAKAMTALLTLQGRSE